MEQFYLLKTEKISQAIYLTSNHLKDNEPIKWELRREGLSFLYDEKNLYADNTVYIIIPYYLLPRNKYSQLNSVINDTRVKLSREYSLLFLLSIINSSLFKWLFQKFFSFGLDIYPAHIKKLPVRMATPKQQKAFIEIVARIFITVFIIYY